MFQPVIKWSGSKRSQAATIIRYLPDNFNCYYEPFIGGGSVMYAARPKKGVCSDICKPLIDLWKEIKEHPEELAESYRERWELRQEKGYQVFYDIRDRFNKSNNPQDLMFLSRTCVNGLIRFNKNGDFNNSLHHTRPGISPDRLKKVIMDWSGRIQGITFIASDYRETLATARKDDVIYLDPPYFHTKGRYFGTIEYDAFLDCLERLNTRGIKYILSFDGMRGENNYMVHLPKELYKRHELIPSGYSSFKKVMDKKPQAVLESLYLNW